jgi:hypothetical protein
MKINKQYLKNLTQEEIEFSGDFLKTVFIEDKKNIDLKEHKIQTVIAIFKAVTSWKMKTSIIESLNSKHQKEILTILTKKEKHEFLLLSSNSKLTKYIFKSYSEKEQQKLLKTLFNQNRAKYQELKNSITEKIQLVGPIWLEKNTSSDTSIENEKQHILNSILDSKLSFEDTAMLANRIKNNYELEDLEKIILSVAEHFTKLAMSMTNPETFLVHLKFHYFMSPFLKDFQKLQVLYKKLINECIFSLNTLPNEKWIIKVLNQFPLTIIKRILQTLMGHEKIADFNKRNIYCKILNKIKQNLDLKEAANIRFAFSQL